MGQKCPFCGKSVATEGMKSGETVLCPYCRTEVIVGGDSGLISGLSGGGQSAPAGRGPVNGPVRDSGGADPVPGSYSIKFDGSVGASENIFEPIGGQQAAERTRVAPEPLFEPAPPAKPVQQPVVGDPDSTIGFGGDDPFGLTFDIPRSSAPPPASSQAAAPADPMGFDLDAVLSEDLYAESPWGGSRPDPKPEPAPEYGYSSAPADIPGASMGTGSFDTELGRALDGDDDFLGDLEEASRTEDVLDIGDIQSIEDFLPPEEAAPVSGVGAAAADKTVTGSGKASKAARTQRQPKARKEAAAAKGQARAASPARTRKMLILVVALVLVGVILGQTDYGYFGMNLIAGAPAGTGKMRTVDTTVTVVSDSRQSFIDQINQLEKAYKENDSESNLARLILTLNKYRERYPAAFAADPRLTARLNELRTKAPGKGQAGDMTQVMDMIAQGKYNEAKAVLDSLVAATAQNVDVLYYYGKIALATGKPEEAQKYFELALIKNPGLISAKYFLARSFLDQEKLIEAKSILREIINKEAKHLSSRVLSANIALKEQNFEEARQMAEQVIQMGTPGADTEDIFEAHRVMARVYEAGGQPAERLSELRTALALKPSDEATAVEAGRMLISNGKRGESLEVLKPCREQGCASEDFLLVFAEAAFADEKPDVARAAVDEGAAKYPESPRFNLLMGRYHLREGHVRSAVSALEAAIKVKADYVEAYTLMADALVQEGKLQDAVTALKAGLESAGQNADILLKLAEVNIDQRDFPAAEESLRAAVAVAPDNDIAQLKLGMVVKAQGRNDEAAAILNVLEKKKALDFKGTIALAEAYLEMSDTARARDILARLYSENPGEAEAATAYGKALGASEEYVKAVEVLTKVGEQFPNNAVSRFYLGDIHMVQKKYQEAINYYFQAVKLNPDNYGYRLALARAYLALENVDGETEAKNQLDAIVAAYQRGDVPLEDQDADAYLLRGRILFARQKYSIAMKDFEAALNRSPSRRDILVEFGKSLFEMTHYSEAAAYFKQVLDGDSLNPDANYYLGRIFLRDGETETARVHLVAAVKRNPAKFPEAHRLLGLIYRDRKMVSLSQQSFRQYLKYTADKNSSEAVEVSRMLGSSGR